MRLSTLGLIIIAGLALWPISAVAQGRSPPFTPSRPTVSPYLNLLRRDGGPITNYYTQVRPQQQQQQINQQQQSLLRTQQQGLQRVQDGLLEIRQPQATPTGTGGGFMDYSHFYSFQRSALGRR